MTTALKKLVTEGKPFDPPLQNNLLKVFNIIRTLNTPSSRTPQGRADREYAYKFLQGVEADVPFVRASWGDDVADNFLAVIKAYQWSIREFKKLHDKLDIVEDDFNDIEQTGMLSRLVTQLHADIRR